MIDTHMNTYVAAFTSGNRITHQSNESYDFLSKTYFVYL